MDARTWIEAYGNAWREKDDAALGALFIENAIYRSSPFREPARGREAIRAYWRQATASQERFDLRFGEPVIDGNRAAVEWWATMTDEPWAKDEGADSPALTLPGCLVLRFNGDGLCEELREYWHVQFGEPVEPPEGWGR